MVRYLALLGRECLLDFLKLPQAQMALVDMRVYMVHRLHSLLVAFSFPFAFSSKALILAYRLSYPALFLV